MIEKVLNCIVGIDIGNATTEGVVAYYNNKDVKYLKSGMTKTTGIKGTSENIDGVKKLIKHFENSILNINVTKILINNATPVIADFAMDTITETVITDSTMIGHNPGTPGGEGFGTGLTFDINNSQNLEYGKSYIAVVDSSNDFNSVARKINTLVDKGYLIKGAILQKDEGTLVNNRLNKTIPIVDEVIEIKKVNLGLLCAVEVAPIGFSIDLLSNPYGIATAFNLTAAETEHCRMISKALIGNRSAVVIKTPKGEIAERIIPAGNLEIVGEKYSDTVPIDSGAESIMSIVNKIGKVVDIIGEPGTNIGGMIENIKVNMAKSMKIDKTKVKISDLLAVDTTTSVPVRGSLANEYAMENSIAVASMVNSNTTTMQSVAKTLERELNIPVEAKGIEGEMALKGALTTPGTQKPLVIIDIGAGSTDAALIDENGNVKSTHLAGAGDLVTMIIDSELNLNDFELAEKIKINQIAKVESLFKIRYENGNIKFFDNPLPTEYYGRIVTIGRDGRMDSVDTDQNFEKIGHVRQQAKRRVLVTNVFRSLDTLGVDHNICKHVVLIGGSFLDFEASNLVTEALSDKRLVAGKGNIRGIEGPRNAVATGLAMNNFCI